MLSVIAIVHEFGHLIVAKFFGVYCKEFSIGMGPMIYSKKFKETKYSIRAFLIGGYVAMAGETDENDPDIESLNIPKERTLKGIAKWKQVLIMFAGIFMNFLLALIIYSLIILNVGTFAIESKPVIGQIQENMPAYNSGLMVGDIVTKIEFDNGLSNEPDNYTELSAFLASSYDGNGSWKLTVERNGEEHLIEVTPTYLVDESRYVVGLVFDNTPTKVVKINIFNSFIYAFIYMIQMVKMIFVSLVALVKGVGLNNLSGPIGVYQVVEQTVSYGIEYYIELLALISVNAAIFNALPVPAFDGGRVFLLLIEVIIGRPLPQKFEQLILTASFVLVMMLMLFVSYNDIIKIIGG